MSLAMMTLSPLSPTASPSEQNVWTAESSFRRDVHSRGHLSTPCPSEEKPWYGVRRDAAGRRTPCEPPSPYPQCRARLQRLLSMPSQTSAPPVPPLAPSSRVLGLAVPRKSPQGLDSNLRTPSLKGFPKPSSLTSDQVIPSSLRQ